MAEATNEKQLHLLKNAFAHALGLLTILESISFPDTGATFDPNITWQTLYRQERKPPANIEIMEYIKAVREDMIRIGGQTGAWHDEADIKGLSQGFILAFMDRMNRAKQAQEEGALIDQLQTTICDMADKVVQMRRDSNGGSTILSSGEESNMIPAKERAEVVCSLEKDADNIKDVLRKLSYLDEERNES